MSDTPPQKDYPPQTQYGQHAQYAQQPAFVNKAPEVNVNAAMQIALTVLALAAVPISAWLYIASYVEDRVETAITQQEKVMVQSAQRQTDELENLRGYALNLCIGVREIDPTFSCGSSYASRAAFRYERN